MCWNEIFISLHFASWGISVGHRRGGLYLLRSRICGISILLVRVATILRLSHVWTWHSHLAVLTGNRLRVRRHRAVRLSRNLMGGVRIRWVWAVLLLERRYASISRLIGWRLSVVWSRREGYLLLVRCSISPATTTLLRISASGGTWSHCMVTHIAMLRLG